MMTPKNKSLAIKLGKAIAGLRIEKGLTQEQLGERLGIGLEATSRMERGIAPPSIFRLFELSEIFQCEVSELLSETSSRPQDQSALLMNLIADLSESDRQFILETIRSLANRLKHNSPPRTDC